MATKLAKSGGWKMRYERAAARARNVSKKADKVVETAVHTAEVGSAAFLAGVVQGRYGAIEIVGVPVELLGGIGLHMVGFMGNSRNASHMHGFANGLLAAYATTAGRGVGRTWKSKALKGGTKTSGLVGAGASLSQADLDVADMAASI